MIATLASGDDKTVEEERVADGSTVPEEVRRAVIDIAATTVGLRPPAEIPRSLHAVARFTPSRRAHRGAAQLWKAAAEDDEFRDLLGDVAAQAMPDLAEQVRSADVPADADRVLVGVLQYLLRPAGWQDALIALAEELAREREQRDSEGAVVQAQHDLARAAATIERLTSELAQAREAERAGAQELEAQVARLKKEIRTLKASVVRAEKSAAHAQAARDELEIELARRAATATEEARRSAVRLAALEAELESRRQSGRAARDHDEVRLWLLLEQLAHAADGIRGMALARDPGVRPADAASDLSDPLEVRRSVLDRQSLDRLLHGRHVHLIIDGYNLTKHAWGDVPLVEQRARLAVATRALAQRRGIEVTVVFDGAGATESVLQPVASSHFRVRFSPENTIADDLIRELLALEPPGRTVVVASSDKEVAASARSWRAWSVTAETMLDQLGRS